MANSGRAEGSHCDSGLCIDSYCNGCSSNFSFWCGIYWWVTRDKRVGTVHYKLQIYTSSSYFVTYGLHKYDTYLNGGYWGTIDAGGYGNRVNQWLDLPGVETSQSFTYNDNGTAPAVWINNSGASFRCVPFCRGSWTTSIGGFHVYPDAVTPDWNRKPGNISGSASNTSCTGTKITFSVGDKGVPSSITSQVQYGTTTSYGQATATTTAASGSFTLSNLQPATTYHYRIKTTNSTGTSYSPDYTFKTKGSKPSATTMTTTNPGVYQLKFVLSGITWEGTDGCTITTKSATLKWEYTMDGQKYSFTRSWSGSSLGDSITANVTGENNVPDDETVSYTWTLHTNIGDFSKSGSIYCQPSYQAFVIGPSTNYEYVECELYASEKAGVKSYKKVRRVRSIT